MRPSHALIALQTNPKSELPRRKPFSLSVKLSRDAYSMPSSLAGRSVNSLGSRTERDEARISRECSEILADLPLDVTEAEGKEALEPTVREASQEIRQRQAEKERQTRKANLIQQGVAEVSSYLLQLRLDQEIAAEDYFDSEFTADLRRPSGAALKPTCPATRPPRKSASWPAKLSIKSCLDLHDPVLPATPAHSAIDKIDARKGTYHLRRIAVRGTSLNRFCYFVHLLLLDNEKPKATTCQLSFEHVAVPMPG